MDWESSGLTQVEFCRQRGLNVSSFQNCKHKLAKRAALEPVRRRARRPSRTGTAGRAFVPVQVGSAGTSVGWWLELQLLGGRVLRLGQALPASEVAGLAAALER